MLQDFFGSWGNFGEFLLAIRCMVLFQQDIFVTERCSTKKEEGRDQT
jgi:hypothetical protein